MDEIVWSKEVAVEEVRGRQGIDELDEFVFVCKLSTVQRRVWLDLLDVKEGSGIR